MSFSDNLEAALLDHVFGNTAYTPPATFHVALFTTAPNTETGASGVEVSGTGYTRAAVTNNTTNWPAASGGSKSNGTQVNFPTPGSGGWGNVVAFGIYSASTGGTLLGSANLAIAKTINQNDPVNFPVGQLTITLN
ncbi:MAG TPA: hypothetical protein V6C88_17280 [Chroococcidiopsis sp.]